MRVNKRITLVLFLFAICAGRDYTVDEICCLPRTPVDTVITVVGIVFPRDHAYLSERRCNEYPPDSLVPFELRGDTAALNLLFEDGSATGCRKTGFFFRCKPFPEGTFCRVTGTVHDSALSFPPDLSKRCPYQGFLHLKVMEIDSLGRPGFYTPKSQVFAAVDRIYKLGESERGLLGNNKLNPCLGPDRSSPRMRKLKALLAEQKRDCPADICSCRGVFPDVYEFPPHGTIKRRSGEPVSGAEIQLTHKRTGSTLGVFRSNRTGTFDMFDHCDNQVFTCYKDDFYLRTTIGGKTVSEPVQIWTECGQIKLGGRSTLVVE